MKTNQSYIPSTERYMQGLTDIQEEEQLLDFLRNKPASQLTSEEKVVLMMLGGAAACRRQMPAREEELKAAAHTTLPSPRHKLWSNRWIMSIGSIAAVAAVALWFQSPANYPHSNNVLYGYGQSAGKPIDEDEAFILAEKALAEVAYDATQTLEW